MRVITMNAATLDGRIAVSTSTPVMRDSTWKALERYEGVDFMALHEARILLQGSSSFVAREAGPAAFTEYEDQAVPPGDFLPPSLQRHQGMWMVVIDSRARVRWTIFEAGGGRLAVLVSETTPAPYRAFLRDHGVPYFEVGGIGWTSSTRSAESSTSSGNVSSCPTPGESSTARCFVQASSTRSMCCFYQRSWARRKLQPSLRDTALAHPRCQQRLSSSPWKHGLMALSSLVTACPDFPPADVR